MSDFNLFLHFFFYFHLHIDMRRDVQEIFRNTPHEKQVLMFSATLSKEVRPICKKFMQDVRIFPPAAQDQSASSPPAFTCALSAASVPTTNMRSLLVS